MCIHVHANPTPSLTFLNWNFNSYLLTCDLINSKFAGCFGVEAFYERNDKDLSLLFDEFGLLEFDDTGDILGSFVSVEGDGEFVE